jgi:ATP-binding cassette subfamily B protein
MIGPIDQIYTSSSLLSSLFEGINRVDSLLKEPALSMPEQGDMPKHYDIAFRDVSFSYGANDVLSGVSVELGEGKLHAFVGASGAGKSTAAQLLLRFWDVQSGGITIGGKDIRDISYDALMSMVSFVFQDSFLLDATVAENIALGQPDAPRERIVAAARTAQAHGFIEQLEHGYDTRIGSGGTHLSGGEKQRIAIARALFKDCPIIVFDEATSSSDTGKQAEISRAIKGLAGEKTVIVITHHLSTALGADQILVFDHGRLAGSGAHGDLLEGCAEYRHLWEKTAPLRQWVLTTDGEVRHAAAH